MKQTTRIISTYTGDTSGVCSALYELGGMTIMHDPSGCNSTYNTHDEPRWYDFDSLVFISALTETDAILGNDQKLIDDIVETALKLHPNFIAVAGTPIPMMTGVDFMAIATQVEKITGVPSFGFQTNGMHTYASGVSVALKAVTERFCTEKHNKTKELSVNILGATPLDFSVNGTINSMREVLAENGIKVNAVFAMGNSLETLKRASAANVNLVVSSVGIESAKSLYAMHGMPFVIGAPFSKTITSEISQAIKKSADDNENRDVLKGLRFNSKNIIIGESVTSLSLSKALKEATGREYGVISPTEEDIMYYKTETKAKTDEDDIIPLLKDAEIIIADPLYKPICPNSAMFVSLPHEAFSGRIYRNDILNLSKDFNILRKETEK